MSHDQRFVTLLKLSNQYDLINITATYNLCFYIANIIHSSITYLIVFKKNVLLLKRYKQDPYPNSSNFNKYICIQQSYFNKNDRVVLDVFSLPSFLFYTARTFTFKAYNTLKLCVKFEIAI